MVPGKGMFGFPKSSAPRRSAAGAPLVRWLFGLVLTLAACDCGDSVLATVSAHEGSVERDEARALGRWQAAALGDELRLGDGLRTGPEATASLELASGVKMDLEPDTLIRFRTAGDEQDQRIEVVSGEVVVETPADGAGGLELALELGDVRLAAGSQARVRADSSLEVIVGQAVIERGDGTEATAQAGEVIDVDAGLDAGDVDAGIVDIGEEDAGVEEDAGEEDAGEGTESGGVDALAPGPARADLLLSAGGSVTIHAPTLPVRIGVSAPDCAGQSVLRAGRRRALAVDGEAHLALPPGRHRWTLTCAGNEVSRGSARILRDGGTRRMPRIPPRNVIDADGRPYRVLYQNQLPSVLVRWAGAQGNPPYRLTLQRPGGSAITRTAATPRFEFRSGQVPEGTHSIQVRSASGDTSPTTRLTIRFDNAAPTASVSAPANRSFAPGATVTVSGTAAPGWQVRVGGQELPLGDQYRFNGEVTAPVNRDSLVLQLVHPRRGTHYYLRRADGS
ncbi:MAG: FecR domain-containing protein [Polyangiales bacterium]